MKRIIVDLDGTLTVDDPTVAYSDKVPNEAVVAKLREYKCAGFEIAISTARNMRTHEGNLGKINIHTLPIILDWLRKFDVPFDEVFLGKPWCGAEGFYIDDKAIRPDEFVGMSYEEISKLLMLGVNSGQ